MKPIFRMLLLSIFFTAVSATQAGTPRLARLNPPGGQRGTTVEVQFIGRYLEKADEVLMYEPGIVVESVEAVTEIDSGNGRKQPVEAGTRVKVRMKIGNDCELGLHGLRLRTAAGLSEYQRFFVGPFPTIDESETSPQKRNDKRDVAQDVPLNSTVLGRMIDPTAVDLFRIEVKLGQRISAEIESTRLGVDQGLPDLHVAVLDADGKPLMAADDSALFVQDPVVSLVAPRDGTYFIEVRHSTYSAANDVYRLHIGSFSRPTAVYPAGGQVVGEGELLGRFAWPLDRDRGFRDPRNRAPVKQARRVLLRQVGRLAPLLLAPQRQRDQREENAECRNRSIHWSAPRGWCDRCCG